MSDLCKRLHRFSWGLETLRHPIDPGGIPRNGIYLVFERGEKGHERDRIVRIGTHTGDNQLPSRLKQHFIRENKDRSIFRKNIGRALLASCADPYLETWELDLTSRGARIRHQHRIDHDHQAAIERSVTKYIQGRFWVALIREDEKEARLTLESRLVSTVSLCQECQPSEHWLGRHSPKKKIRESGLWQVNELYKDPLTVPQIKALAASASRERLRRRYIRERPDENSIEIHVRTISWSGPTTPQSAWVVAAKLGRDAPRGEVEASVRRVLDDDQHFGVCRHCSEYFPRGRMHGRDVCMSCAERHLGIVH